MENGSEKMLSTMRKWNLKSFNSQLTATTHSHIITPPAAARVNLHDFMDPHIVHGEQREQEESVPENEKQPATEETRTR